MLSFIRAQSIAPSASIAAARSLLVRACSSCPPPAAKRTAENFPRLVFIGAPGVGKGTYASRICTQFNVPHMAVGDFVRREITAGSAIGVEMKSFVSRGALVPDGLINDLLAVEMKKISTGFILDGYPRTRPQAEMLDTIVAVDRVFNLTQDEEFSVKKMAGRRVCAGCGKGYNLADLWNGTFHLPPLLPKKEGLCDGCGTGLVQRDDDREEVVRARLVHYHAQSKPVEDYYRAKNLVTDFNIVGSVKDHLKDLTDLVLSV